MAYVIRRVSAGSGWVAKAGSRNSYTTTVQRARIFGTLEEARSELCVDNEVIETHLPHKPQVVFDDTVPNKIVEG